MRLTLALLTVLCGLNASTASAQSLLRKVSPGELQFQPINTANVVTPANLSSGSSPFAFDKLFRKFNNAGSLPTLGQSNLPKPSQFPSTKYRNSFVPQQPIYPKK